ncbi:MAG: hypothetical protein A3E85_01175 [Gammaproteobacteria bacterium RIFCSPHIGHO2_12_FULL_45_12]|nr:MAG: hypothetical protein A3E85_01175 [Gammaproteobacteria bacterium RIFCSPHIGHO2_12_FULL_45_12]
MHLGVIAQIIFLHSIIEKRFVRRGNPECMQYNDFSRRSGLLRPKSGLTTTNDATSPCTYSITLL